MSRPIALFPWHWLPPLCTLALVLLLHVDVPYHDQWDLLPLLDAALRNEFRWADLLQPHNGHILLLPKLVMLALALLTQWNTLAEVLFGFLCMLGSWLLLQAMAAQVLSRPLLVVEKTVLSLLVFSWSQAQNWLWGWQLQIPLALLLLLCGFAALQRLRHDGAAVLLAALCGIAAMLSFAGSLPFWPAVLPLLWQRRRWLVIPWLLLSCLLLFAYARVAGMVATDDASAALPAANEILRHLRNTLALLGNLVARFNLHAATAAGLCGVLLLLWQARPRTATVRALGLSVLLFAAGTALLVSLTRSGLGDEQMLASRYGTLTLPFWVVVAVLLSDAIHSKVQPMRLAIAGCLLFSLLASQAYSWQDFYQLHRRLERGAVALQQIDTEQGRKLLPVINPRSDRERAVQEVLLLRQYRLSAFRDDAP